MVSLKDSIDELMNDEDKEAQDDEEIFDEYVKIKQVQKEDENLKTGDGFNELTNLMEKRDFGKFNNDDSWLIR